jgi:hypothetical protein
MAKMQEMTDTIQQYKQFRAAMAGRNPQALLNMLMQNGGVSQQRMQQAQAQGQMFMQAMRNQ